jgi:hypothetical protein
MPLLNRRRSSQFEPGLLDRSGQIIIMDGGRRVDGKREEGIENFVSECERTVVVKKDASVVSDTWMKTEEWCLFLKFKQTHCAFYQAREC